MIGVTIRKLQVASSKYGGDHKCACFNTIRNDAVSRAVKLLYALDADGVRPCALNPCAHLGEQSGQVYNFRLARAVLHDGFTFSESGGHHEIFSAGNGNLVKNNVAAAQAICTGFNISVLLLDRSTKAFQPFDVEIDRPRANGAAAGLRNAGASHTRKQRT